MIDSCQNARKNKHLIPGTSQRREIIFLENAKHPHTRVTVLQHVTHKPQAFLFSRKPLPSQKDTKKNSLTQNIYFTGSQSCHTSSCTNTTQLKSTRISSNPHTTKLPIRQRITKKKVNSYQYTQKFGQTRVNLYILQNTISYFEVQIYIHKNFTQRNAMPCRQNDKIPSRFIFTRPSDKKKKHAVGLSVPLPTDPPITPPPPCSAKISPQLPVASARTPRARTRNGTG